VEQANRGCDLDVLKPKVADAITPE